MMKFFRKYTKHLLAVFMALLLVVWLGGTALQDLFNKERDFSNELVAHAFGKEVKQRDLARVSSQGEIGASLVYGWNTPWMRLVAQMAGGDEQMFQAMMMNGRRDPLTLEEWFLLDAEAVRKGVHVSAEAVNQYKANVPADQLTAIRDRRKLSVAQMDEAIHAYLRVEEAAVQAADAVAVSEADIQDFIRQTSEKVKATMVTIDPSKLVDVTYQPAAEQIAAQFDKYKDRPAGGPGSYGYQLPEATQVEYIEIVADELAKKQMMTDDDEAFLYWKDHKTEFKRPATQPVTSAPATRPEAPKPYDTFTDAKADVKKKLAHDKAVRAATHLAEELIRQLNKPWEAAATTQPGGYRQPPASEMAGDVYEKLVAGLKSKHGEAINYGRTPLGEESALTVTPIGRAWAFGDSPQRVMFGEAAFMVNGLSTPKDDKSLQARLFRNVYETAAEPLTDSKGNVYVFRNLAVRPVQAPAAVDEVREKVVADLRQIRAYEEAGRIAQELTEKARQSDLKTAFEADATLKAKMEGALAQPEPFSRQRMFNMGGMPRLYDGFVPGVGRDPELMTLLFGMAERTATQPSAKVAAHEQKDRQRWLVVQFDNLLPVTRDEYNQMRDQARRFLLATRRLEFVLNWFSHEAIIARTHWQEATPEEKNLRSMRYTPRSPSEALAWQQGVRAKLFEAMKVTGWAGPHGPLMPQQLAHSEHAGYAQREVEFNSTPSRRVQAIVTVPTALPSVGLCPAVVCIHGHDATRKSVYRPELIYKGFAAALAGSGYVTIAVNVGQHKVYEANQTLIGERLWDLMRCVDYLAAMPEVDTNRVGCAGLSLGGEMAMWLGAMDQRIHATVSCGFLTCMDQMERNHCKCWKFPGLREVVDWPDVYSLVAPRPLQCQNGLAEPADMFPVPLATQVMAEVKQIYSDFGVPNGAELAVHPGAHVVDVPMLMAFFNAHLAAQAT